MSNRKPMSRTEDLVIQESNGEILIYDLRTNKAFCLNETSSLVWKACDGTRNVSEIRTNVSNALGSKLSDDFIWLALDQLKNDLLVEDVPDSSGRFKGLSRREVIRKVAVGSLVALPVVAGLVAPPAYAQASVCGTTCTCKGTTTSGQICSTIGGGVACPGSPAGCTVCRATTDQASPAATSPGVCFTA